MLVIAGCNPTRNVAVYNKINEEIKVVYASGKNVILANIKTAKDKEVLFFAKDTVNALSWTDSLLIAAGSDGLLYFYSFEHSDATSTVDLTSPVHFIDTLDNYSIAGCINGSVHVLLEKQICYSIQLKEKITSLKLLKLQENHYFILVGASDSQVKVFSVNGSQLFSLEGHTNWISALASDRRGLIATGSHDKSIRLWRVFNEPPHEDKKLKEFATMKNFAVVDGFYLRIELESVLLGHEDWVHSVSFDVSGRLLSSAGDGSVMLWSRVGSIWQSVFQVGQPAPSGGPLSSDLYDAIIFSNSSECEKENVIIAHSSTGSFLKWKGDTLQELNLSGHFKAVEDLSWSPDGSYLLSVSEDRTTRAFVFSKDDEMLEIARPQIHGYEMRSVAFLGDDRILSAADEKVIRVFKESELFKVQKSWSEGIVKKRVVLSALGLSNKEEDGEGVQAKAYQTEIDLCRDTLWPELNKLYSHGDELYTLVVSPNGEYFASVAKSSLAGDSAIRLWDAKTLKVLQKLPLHQLTVVQLSFSPDSTKLLSVSRDRTSHVYDIPSSKVIRTINAHSRIIWAGQWLSDSHFVTGGRDGKLFIWSLQDSEPSSSWQFNEGITAVCVVQSDLIIGLEGGIVKKISNTSLLGEDVCQCSDSISRIVYNPQRKCIAIASRDHSIRIIFI